MGRESAKRSGSSILSNLRRPPLARIYTQTQLICYNSLYNYNIQVLYVNDIVCHTVIEGNPRLFTQARTILL